MRGVELGTSDEGEPGYRATPEQMRRKHVFVVNGSPEFLDVMRELLQEERYNVTTTNFVPSTFDQIQAGRPALIIVDLVLGEIASWDLLAKLRAEAAEREIPIILVSTQPALLERALAEQAAYGGDRRLTKPFDFDDMLTAIQELIGSA